MTEERVLEGPSSTVTLRLQDCLEGLPELGRRIGVVVTSPPYNLGVKYAHYDDTVDRPAYLEWSRRWLDLAFGGLVDQGSLFLNIAGKPSDPMVPFQVLSVAAERFRLQNVVHWVKSIAIAKSDVGDYPGITQDVSVGHFKPVNSPRFLNDCHEYIFHLTKSGAVPLDRLAVGVPYQDKSNVTRWRRAGADRRCRGNTWFIPYETISRRERDRPHPASFPVRLPEMCLRLHGLDRAGLVVDPFLGLGSTARACVRLGLDFVGFEIDPGYFAEAVRRVEAEIVAVQQTSRPSAGRLEP